MIFEGMRTDSLMFAGLRVSRAVDDPDSSWTRRHHLPQRRKSPLLCRNKGAIYKLLEIAYGPL